ncbi:uncharacterized protein RAG0_13444 [Rhynchosporium agropyri]|uniref:Heterokaryon incompatibility domain-containing protein n=1 Tax=Rhynchosporium agropyri TaxID=914238 RepID=A0A1E1LD67_9HELO|nr:uncharacterized protein RAG0_13444 [Rhynchosporium agropyri]
MAVALTVGTAQLLQLGVSLSDVALVLSQGRKVGNWLRTSNNDEELLSSIGEKQEAILKRRDLVDVTYMERKWNQIAFVYQGHHHNSSSQIQNKSAVGAGLSAFSWLMVVVVAALDLCLPSTGIKSLIRKVFKRVLNGDDEQEDSLRVLLITNIESWRETGCVRNISGVVAHAVRDCRLKHIEGYAISQLNPAEIQEMEEFLVWLLKGDSYDFQAVSVIVFAVAVGIGKAKVKIRTEGSRIYETEPVVQYIESGRLNIAIHSVSESHGIGSAAQQISYPRGNPHEMIESIRTSRTTHNRMSHLWDLGSKAASKIYLVAEAEFPYTQDSEIYYVSENRDESLKRFGTEVLMLAERSFPEQSESVLLAIEVLAEGVEGEKLTWLHQRTELDFLKRAKVSIDDHTEENVALWLQYQALVFGFYYELLSQLISFDLVQEQAYFKGLWGHGSTTFLAMCVEFGDIMRRQRKISRSHVLYMLSTMYAGRQKSFAALSTGKGLLGIIGPISILAKPLLRTTDIPNEIASSMLVDLPILDLAPDVDGELQDCLKSQGQFQKWSIHAKMGVLFGDGMPGVVMAARCEGRLVGWFNPIAADVAFLSTAYVKKRHEEEADYTDTFTFEGFEVDDHDWQDGHLPRWTGDKGTRVGIVHSTGCPALRYAAAGMYVEVGDEIAIATDDLETAHGRVDGQDGGMIIG